MSVMAAASSVKVASPAPGAVVRFRRNAGVRNAWTAEDYGSFVARAWHPTVDAGTFCGPSPPCTTANATVLTPSGAGGD